MQRIVVGIDGSEGARRALDWAIEEAELRHARLQVVHTWDAPFEPTWGTMGVDVAAYEESARELLDDEVEDRVVGAVRQNVEKQLVRGGAAIVLVGLSKDADLLVIGSRGRGGFAGLLLGSVSQQVAHHATCPVVIVPPG
jgi:nucleotide-binding universal stress UspA family protein